jgi:hypothetical protein
MSKDEKIDKVHSHLGDLNPENIKYLETKDAFHFNLIFDLGERARVENSREIHEFTFDFKISMPEGTRAGESIISVHPVLFHTPDTFDVDWARSWTRNHPHNQTVNCHAWFSLRNTAHNSTRLQRVGCQVIVAKKDVLTP